MRMLVLVITAITIINVYTFEYKKPTVLIAIFARNKQHTLPYFLTSLENLNYPKERISLWIRSDNNQDKTIEILKLWISSVDKLYHSINAELLVKKTSDFEEKSISHWTDKRFRHVINLREASLEAARKIWADYYFSIDCDVFLTNPEVLNYLISKNLTVVAPMLKSEGLYSNFWYGMTEDYYYLRTDEYKPVLHRENTGCFSVPMIHSCVLIDLNKPESDLLTYVPEKNEQFKGPIDDIITFAVGATLNGIYLNLCNEERFGYVMVPLSKEDSIEVDYEQLRNIKLEVLNYEKPLQVNKLLKQYTFVPEKDTLGFDQIYMINLVRRPERRKRMMKCFDELGLNATIFDAVDGKLLEEKELEKISFMPDFIDPYHKRPMTLGEIGCFLSHFKIWEQIVKNGYSTTLILEDDVRFESFFRSKAENILNELRVYEWDLVYFGRKHLQENEEPWVEGSNLLVKAGYSYWTLGYALSLKGAQKLLDADPLSKLVPVDEYLPILFNKHPEERYKRHFLRRDLIAFSTAPLLIYPTHYTGDKGYISDTEDSKVIDKEVETMPGIRDDL